MANLNRSNLSSDVWAQLLASPEFSNPGGVFTDASGNTYHGGWSGGTGNPETGYDPFRLDYILQDATPGKNGVGDLQHIFDPATGGYKYSATVPKSENGLIPLLMVLGGMGATLGGLGAAGAGAAGSGTGAGVSGAAFGDAGLMYGGADAAAAGSLGGGASLSGAAGAGATTAATTAATGGTMSGLSSLLGPAATLLGAVAGSQGQKASSTQQKDIPEWLKPYVLGNGTNPGLLNYANTLLNQQMQPGYLQGYDQMRSLGQSLLSAPVQGNGFNRFFPGK